MKYLILFLPIIILSQEYILGDSLPSKPWFWDIYITPLGADEDNDGVRDDLEWYIYENTKDPYIRLAMRQWAKTQQHLYKTLFDSSNDEVHQNYLKMSASFMCLDFFVNSYTKSGDQFIDRFSDQIISNNPIRRWVYPEIIFYKMTDKVINEGLGHTTEESHVLCNFEIPGELVFKQIEKIKLQKEKRKKEREKLLEEARKMEEK